MSLLTGMMPSENLSRALKAMQQNAHTHRMPMKFVAVPIEKIIVTEPVLPSRAANRAKKATVKAYWRANPTASRAETAAACGCGRSLLDIARAEMRRDGEIPPHVSKQDALLAAIRADGSMDVAAYAKVLGCSVGAVNMTLHYLYRLGRARRVCRYEVIDA